MCKLTRAKELSQRSSESSDLRSVLTGDVSTVLRGDMLRRECGSGEEQLLCASVGGNIEPAKSQFNSWN